MAQQDIESLERKASAHYLEGDYQAARIAWHALLELDPQNEQALEGIRLCRQLGDAHDADGAGAGPFSIEYTSHQDAPNFDDLADDFLQEVEPKTGSPFVQRRTEPETDSPFGELQMDLLQDQSFLAISDPLSESLKDSLEELTLESDDELMVTMVSSEETASSAEAEAEAAAAAELRRRVNELLTGAVSAMEQGQRDEALGLLSRVLILDEENATAASLLSKIQGEIAAELQQQQFSEPALEVDWPDQTQPAAPVMERSFDEPETPSRARPIEMPPPPAPAPSFPAKAEAVAEGSGPTKAPAKRAARQPWRRLPLWLLIPSALLLLAVAIWFSWRGPGSRTDAEAPAASPIAASSAPQPRASHPVQRDTIRAESAVPEQKNLGALLGRADAAYDTQDFAAAVLAYNEALKLDPDSDSIQQKLVLAGNRYREQRAVLDQWQQATEAFGNGDYERALHLLYRLPKGEDAADIQRYILNGWFNLGVQTLRVRDCRSALSNFREAEAVSASDPQVQAALRLAKSCPIERGTTSFVVAVEGLRLRAMRD